MVKVDKILVDSLYINNSGGLVLLKYLVETIESKGMSVFYLFDERCKSDFKDIPSNRKLYVKASLLNRYKFYLKNRNRFSNILCFGNMPPFLVNKKTKVLTYFHNVLLLNLPENYSLKIKIRSFVRRFLFFLLKKNTNYWVVQSDNVKTLLNEKAKISKRKILVYPFFSLDVYDISEKDFIKNSFIYPSTGAIHKNHLMLLSAWERIYDQGFKPKLSLTIKSLTLELKTEIERLKIKGLDIVNLGEIKFDDLKGIYKKSEYLVYPSLFESFGLPLIEAINYGCKVIASDLPYVYKVISPSAVFNPNDIESFEKSILESMCNELPRSEVLVKNEITEMINFLSE